MAGRPILETLSELRAIVKCKERPSIIIQPTTLSLDSQKTVHCIMPKSRSAFRKNSTFNTDKTSEVLKNGTPPIHWTVNDIIEKLKKEPVDKKNNDLLKTNLKAQKEAALYRKLELKSMSDQATRKREGWLVEVYLPLLIKNRSGIIS